MTTIIAVSLAAACAVLIGFMLVMAKIAIVLEKELPENHGDLE